MSLSPNNPYTSIVNGPAPTFQSDPNQTPQQSDGLLKSFGKGLIKPIAGLAKDIAYAVSPDIRSGADAIQGKNSILQPQYQPKYLQETEQLRGAMKQEQDQQITGFASEKPTVEKVVGDVAGTALLAAPVWEIQALKGLPILSTIVRGGIYGGAFGVTDAMSENKSFKDTIVQGLKTAPFGVLAEVGTSLALKGVEKASSFAFDKAVDYIGSKFPDALSSLSTVLERNYGEVGRIVADKLNTIDANQRQRFGRASLEMIDSGLMEPPRLFPNQSKGQLLTTEAAWKGENSLLDELVGRAKSVGSKAYEVANNLRQMIKTEAESLGVRDKWLDPETYFPKHQPEIFQLKSTNAELKANIITGTEGSMRNDVLYNAVFKDHAFDSMEQAARVLDDYINFVDEGGRVIKGKQAVNDLVAQGKVREIKPFEARTPEEKQVIRDSVLHGNKWLEYMVQTKQAASLEEAAGKTIQDLQHRHDYLTERAGSLDHSRVTDTPFYDPDPRRVIPLYTYDSLGRLENARAFGAQDQKLHEYIGEIQQDPTLGFQKAQKFEETFRKAVGEVTRARSWVDFTRKLRSIQAMKLTFAQIINLGQSLNTYLSSDLKSVGAGLSSAFSDKGIRDAVESGSLVNAMMQKTLSYMGGGTKFANNWLKYTGFQWTETLNRTIAANAGKKYAERMFQQLIDNPKNVNAMWALDELLVDVPAALQAGKIPEQELLRAADVFTAKTQFLSRNIDLPGFMSTPEGKVFTQFKTFAFQQAKFVKDELKRQLLTGNYGGLARDLVVLSAVYPMAGEVLGDLQSIMTGSNPKERGTGLISQKDHPYLDRYLVDLMSIGTVGLWSDAISSAERGNFLEFLAGPTATSASHLVQDVAGAAGGKWKPLIKEILQQTGVGRIINNTVMPAKGKTSVLDLITSMNPLGQTANAAELQPGQTQPGQNTPPTMTKGNFSYSPLTPNPAYNFAGIAQNHPNLPKGFLEALVMQESMMGQSKKSGFAGKYGWLVGMHQGAVTDLKNKKIVVDLSTPQGAIKAAADYSTLRQTGTLTSGAKFVYNDPIDLYTKRYYGRNDTRDTFKFYYDYYSQQ